MQRIFGKLSSAAQGLSITGSSSKKPPADPDTDLWVQMGSSNEERKKAQERVWKEELRSKPRRRMNLEALTGRTGPHVDISNLRLTTLPPSLARLTTVQALNLSRSNLTAFPEVLESISGNLEKLNLSFNKIPNLPPTIGSLKKLVYLDASNNLISFIDDRIKNLTNLKTLKLSGNELPVVSSGVAFLSRLTDLSLAKNHLTDVPALEHLRNLKTLDLSENPLQAIDKQRVPENQVRLPVNLEILLLRSTELEDMPDSPALPEHMGFLEKLRFLDVSSNPFLRELPLEFGAFRPTGKDQVTSSGLPVKLTVKFQDTNVLEGLVEGARLPAGTSQGPEPQIHSAAGGSTRWDQPVDWSHPVAQQVMRSYARQIRQAEATPTPPPWLGGHHPSPQVPPPVNFAVPPNFNSGGLGGPVANGTFGSHAAPGHGLQPPPGGPPPLQPGVGTSVPTNPANPGSHMGLNDLVNTIALVKGLPNPPAEGPEAAASEASRNFVLGQLKDEIVRRVMENGAGLQPPGTYQGVTPPQQYQNQVPARPGLYPSGYASQPYPPQPYPSQTQMQGGLYSNAANMQEGPPAWAEGPGSFQPAAGTAYHGHHWDLLQQQSYEAARDYLAKQMCEKLPPLLPQSGIKGEVKRIWAEENGPQYRLVRNEFEITQAVRNRLIGQLGRSLYRQQLLNQLAIEAMIKQPGRSTNAHNLSIAYQAYLAESLDLPGPIRALYDDLKADPPRLQPDIFDGIVPDPASEIEDVYRKVESEETADLDGGKFNAWLERQEFWKAFTKNDTEFLKNAIENAYR